MHVMLACVEMFQWPNLPFGKLQRFRNVTKLAPHNHGSEKLP